MQQSVKNILESIIYCIFYMCIRKFKTFLNVEHFEEFDKKVSKKIDPAEEWKVLLMLEISQWLHKYMKHENTN